MSDAFQDRVLNDLLIVFSELPNRAWCREGFRRDWTKVSDLDALDFLRAMDASLVEHVGGGLYRAPRSCAGEMFFWEGSKEPTPRTVTLWVEPVITVAVLARLHFDLGWPKDLLGTQSRGYEFDVTAYRSSDLANEFVACEVKKTIRELDQMVELMQRFAAENTPPSSVGPGKELNAYRKLKGLEARRAQVFWAVGPNGANYVFRMKYSEDGAAFEAADLTALAYPDA